MKKQNAISIEQLNLTLSEKAQIKVVDFETFKKLHMEKGTKFEKMVAHIDYVKRITNGYEFAVNKDNGKQKVVKVLHNGYISTNNREFAMPIDYHNGHIRIAHNGSSSIYIEKLILMCEIILHDALPESFKGICVNVMSGCGNIFTANELGLPIDFSLNNLEWTYTDRNSRHGGRIHQVVSLVGGPCKYSANDEELFELLAIKDNEKAKEHLKKNYLED